MSGLLAQSWFWPTCGGYTVWKNWPATMAIDIVVNDGSKAATIIPSFRYYIYLLSIVEYCWIHEFIVVIKTASAGGNLHCCGCCRCTLRKRLAADRTAAWSASCLKWWVTKISSFFTTSQRHNLTLIIDDDDDDDVCCAIHDADDNKLMTTMPNAWKHESLRSITARQSNVSSII